MKTKNTLITINDADPGYKYLSIISMISVTFLIAAMIFTYHIIEVGPFLTPGGVIPFAITYIMAGIITEVYSYKNAKRIIYGNFICIFIFNITINLLLKLPIPPDTLIDHSYEAVFDHALLVMGVYSAGFLFGDLINAFFMSKWKALLKGKYFFIRLIGASIIGQISFSMIVIPSLYINQLSPERLFQQFLTTIAAKIIVIVFLSYPSFIIVKILRKLEEIPSGKPKVMFNPFVID